MKSILLSVALCAMTTLSTRAQALSEQYQQAMRQTLATMKTQSEKTSVADVLAVANQFERIAGAEPSQWLPRYYAGLLYVYLGFMGKTEAEKDKFLDNADRYVAEADKLAPANDEITVLRAYIAQSRMAIDPMNRWQTYGAQFDAAVTKAIAQNPANPRPYILQGVGLLYTPDQSGGGPKTACPVLQTANEKMATFKPASDLAPNWGRNDLDGYSTKCN
jgi:hypothetical protein